MLYFVPSVFHNLGGVGPFGFAIPLNLDHPVVHSPHVLAFSALFLQVRDLFLHLVLALVRDEGLLHPVHKAALLQVLQRLLVHAHLVTHSDQVLLDGRAFIRSRLLVIILLALLFQTPLELSFSVFKHSDYDTVQA